MVELSVDNLELLIMLTQFDVVIDITPPEDVVALEETIVFVTEVTVVVVTIPS